jgi:hypothetical protein
MDRSIRFEVSHFVMERRMLLTIKALAERGNGLRASAQARQH